MTIQRIRHTWDESEIRYRKASKPLSSPSFKTHAPSRTKRCCLVKGCDEAQTPGCFGKRRKEEGKQEREEGPQLPFLLKEGTAHDITLRSPTGCGLCQTSCSKISVTTRETALHRHRRNACCQDISIQLSWGALKGGKLITEKPFHAGASQLFLRIEHFTCEHILVYIWHPAADFWHF